MGACPIALGRLVGCRRRRCLPLTQLRPSCPPDLAGLLAGHLPGPQPCLRPTGALRCTAGAADARTWLLIAGALQVPLGCGKRPCAEALLQLAGCFASWCAFLNLQSVCIT